MDVQLDKNFLKWTVCETEQLEADDPILNQKMNLNVSLFRMDHSDRKDWPMNSNWLVIISIDCKFSNGSIAFIRYDRQILSRPQIE